MVELLLLGHHGWAGLRYGDAHVNLCVMLAANLWRGQGGLSGVFALMFQRSESLPRKAGQMLHEVQKSVAFRCGQAATCS